MLVQTRAHVSGEEIWEDFLIMYKKWNMPAPKTHRGHLELSDYTQNRRIHLHLRNTNLNAT